MPIFTLCFAFLCKPPLLAKAFSHTIGKYSGKSLSKIPKDGYSTLTTASTISCKTFTINVRGTGPTAKTILLELCSPTLQCAKSLGPATSMGRIAITSLINGGRSLELLKKRCKKVFISFSLCLCDTHDLWICISL